MNDFYCTYPDRTCMHEGKNYVCKYKYVEGCEYAATPHWLIVNFHAASYDDPHSLTSSTIKEVEE